MKLGLGTVQFGMQYGIANNTGKPSSEEASKILSLALQSGIDTLDTASAYGDAEKVLGEIGVTDFKVVSKFLPATSEQEMACRFDESINRLNVKKLYGYVAHRPLALIDNIWQWQFLLQKKKENVIEKIGFLIK
jgi:aryl-alcohol dehydrogenase-like predicted oxidoreductase